MRAFHLAVITAALTFTLLLVGGVVHATGSSLACPDWPLCYGEAFPPMQGGILFEHSHRLLGSLVGLCTLVLSALLVKRTRESSAFRPALFAFALVVAQGLQMGLAVTSGLKAPALALIVYLGLLAVFASLVVVVWRRGHAVTALGLVLFALVVGQGLLGGTTVVLRLPFIVSTAHLGTSFVFFALLIYLALALRGRAPRIEVLAPRWPVALAAGGVYLQSVVGGLVRHTSSGMACGADVLTCQGTVLPPAIGPALLHFGHRVFALVLVGVVVWSTLAPLRAARLAADDPRRRLVRFAGSAAHLLVVVQVLLGIASVLAYLSIGYVTAHLGVAALLFADLVLLFVALGPLGAAEEPGPVTAVAPMASAAG